MKQIWYFTYGVDKLHPFYGGWTEVVAESKEEAIKTFKLHHPDRIPDRLNCAGIYSQAEFMSSKLYTNGNWGHRCHEVLTPNDDSGIAKTEIPTALGTIRIYQDVIQDIPDIKITLQPPKEQEGFLMRLTASDK